MIYSIFIAAREYLKHCNAFTEEKTADTSMFTVLFGIQILCYTLYHINVCKASKNNSKKLRTLSDTCKVVYQIIIDRDQESNPVSLV